MNKVMLIGNVGKDPEVRYVDNGVCTAKVSLATSTPGYTLPNGTQVPERAEWHNLCFGADSPRWSRNMCAKATNSTWKANCAPAITPTDRE